MKPSSFVFAVGVVICASVGVIAAFRGIHVQSGPQADAPLSALTSTSATTTNNTSAPSPTTPPPATASTSTMITVSSPLPVGHVASPLLVVGEARGNWFFEASFPVTLLDGNGTVLAQGVAQAGGEWMTEAFVPFTATLSFATSSTATGTLRLQKDNPSGLPEHDAHLDIPVTF